jgi:ArsR family transcriptional regulator, arsenate/arsenite/antimonite-responsive transcriptional repressor
MSSNLEMIRKKRYLHPMDELATVAAAISDPLRVRILDLLAAGRREEPCCSPGNPEVPAAVCACDIAPALGGLSPSKLAYHLGRLRAAGLVTERRRGKWVYYSVNEPAVAELAGTIAARWSAHPEAPARGRSRRDVRRPRTPRDSSSPLRGSSE